MTPPTETQEARSRAGSIENNLVQKRLEPIGKVVVLFCIGIGTMAVYFHRGVRGFEPWGIFLVFVGLFFSLVGFMLEVDDRQSERIFRAWEIVFDVHDFDDEISQDMGSSALRQALEYLNRDFGGEWCWDIVEDASVYLAGHPYRNCVFPRKNGESFARISLPRMDLTGIALPHADLRGATLHDAILNDAYLIGTDLRGAEMQGTEIRNADLRDAELDRAQLRGADLRDTQLQNSTLWRADLRSVRLRRANLEGADLRTADLRSADLVNANFRGANLTSANLQDADLTGANLQATILRRANLMGANLEGANLADADLTEAILPDT